MWSGFQKGILAVLNSLELNKEKKKNCVNFLGISIWHLNWEDSLADLTNLLDICGIEVITAVGCGSSTEDIVNSAQAEMNIILHDEFGDLIGKWYQENHNIPFVSGILPLGFDELENWITTICRFFSKDPNPALDLIRRKRKRTYRELLAMEERKYLPKGHTFSVFADPSTSYAVVKFLYEYLGMIPAAVSFGRKTEEYLKSHMLDVSEDVANTPVDIVIGNGDLIASLLFRKVAENGFVIESPKIRQVGLREEPALGLEGTMRLLDGILNSICRRPH